MRLIVDLSEHEYGEAVAAVQAEHVKLLGQRTQNSPRQLIWILLIMAMTFAMLKFPKWAQLDARAMIRPPLYGAVLIYFPLIALIGLVSLTNAARQWGHRKLAIKGVLRNVLLLLVMLLAIGFLLSGFPLTQATLPFSEIAAETDWFGTLYPQWPWLLAMGLIGVFAIRSSRIMIRQLWQAQPNLARPRTVELSAFGLTIDEAATQRQYQWPAIVRFLETPHLLLLCPTDITFEPIPKRCFATADELNAARALIKHQMDLSKPHSAFPVQCPSAAPTPITLPLPEPLVPQPADQVDRT